MSTISKSEFAALCRVGKPAVSGWIKAGHLTAPALVGEGRFARIDPELARIQLRERMDPEARLSNGLDTALGDAPLDSETVEEKIKLQRLAQSELRTKKMREEDAERAGRLVDAVEAKARVTRAAAEAKSFFNSTMLDLADQVAVLAAQPAPLTKKSILLALTAGYRAAFVRRYGEPLIHPGYLGMADSEWNAKTAEERKELSDAKYAQWAREKEAEAAERKQWDEEAAEKRRQWAAKSA